MQNCNALFERMKKGNKKESRNSLLVNQLGLELVNQLGLEPRTPSLKGMCSTC